MALTQISTQGIKDGTITGTDLATNIDLVDNQKLRLGTGNDLQIYHDGSHSRILDSGTGHLILQTSEINIMNVAGNEDMIKAHSDGNVELYYDNSKKFETTNAGVEITGDLRFDSSVSGGTIRLEDDQKLFLGGGNDLKLYHDGSNSYLEDAGTGQLRLSSNSFRVNNAANSESMIAADQNGAVELYYDNSKKFETTSSGAHVLGTFEGDNFKVSNPGNNAVLIQNPANGIIGFGANNQSNQVVITAAGDLLIPNDTGKINLGASEDLQIYHDGTHSRIYNGTNDLVIRTPETMAFQGATGENRIVTIKDAQVALYYNNSQKLETTSSGVTVTGSLNLGSGDLLLTGNVDLEDSTGAGNNRIRLGASDDLQIYHDGTDSRIENTTNGDLKIINGGNSAMLIQNQNSFNIEIKTNAEDAIKCVANGAVELYHNDVKKFETKSNGVEIFGQMAVEATSDTVAQFIHSSSGNTIGIIMRHGRGGLSGFSGKMISFRGNDNTEEGSIVIGTTNTAFNTSSDYRLKENETSISNPITKLKTLKPYTFNFKKDPDVKVDGFFAHEVFSVVPIAVTGEKDAVKEDGSIEPQGIDQSKLIPLLTAAVQELIGKVEVLETEVAALKAA